MCEIESKQGHKLQQKTYSKYLTPTLALDQHAKYLVKKKTKTFPLLDENGPK